MATKAGPKAASVPLRVDRETYERVRSMAYRARVPMSALASRAVREGLTPMTRAAVIEMERRKHDGK